MKPARRFISDSHEWSCLLSDMGFDSIVYCALATNGAAAKVYPAADPTVVKFFDRYGAEMSESDYRLLL